MPAIAAGFRLAIWSRLKPAIAVGGNAPNWSGRKFCIAPAPRLRASSGRKPMKLSGRRLAMSPPTIAPGF